jgi:hypothetical protein
MIHARVTVVFQPAGGTPADAVPAANQQVFIDLTPGTMSSARANRSFAVWSGFVVFRRFFGVIYRETLS